MKNDQQSQLTNYTEDEREFLVKQADELRTNNQPCELHTRTQGSIYRGRVLTADTGGIVFQKDDNSQVSVPISLVEKFVGIPKAQAQAWASPSNTENRAKGASAGGGF